MRDAYMDGDDDHSNLTDGLGGKGLKPWSFHGRPALLVMDMQSFFIDDCSPAFLPSAPVIVTRLRRLIEGFRSAGLPVIFTVHKDGGGPMQRWWGRGLNDDWTQELALQPLDSEDVLIKDVYDAFYDGFLEKLLKDKNVDSIVIAGVCTHLCVESTVRSAFCQGFQVIVPSDGTACQNRNHHRASLLNMSHGFAHIDSCEKILAKLEVSND